MRHTRGFAALTVFASGSPSSAHPLSDRMPCGWVPLYPFGDNCTEDANTPVLSLDRIEATWLWGPLGEWDGCPAGGVKTRPQAEGLASDETFDLRLRFVPMGRTEDGALILDGYGHSTLPEGSLSNRAMRHHCTLVSAISS